MNDVSNEPVGLGLAHEVEIMLRKAGATRENFWVPISKSEKLARQVVELVLNPRHIIDLDADPYIPGGCEFIEHVKGGQFEWDPVKVKLYLSDEQQGDSYIKGDKLREELKGKPVFNANLLDYLLAHQELIPEEWKGRAVFFWGTIYRDSDGDLYVRCLRWYGARWSWDYYRLLNNDWHSGYPAAVLATKNNNARKSA